MESPQQLRRHSSPEKDSQRTAVGPQAALSGARLPQQTPYVPFDFEPGIGAATGQAYAGPAFFISTSRRQGIVLQGQGATYRLKGRGGRKNFPAQAGTAVQPLRHGAGGVPVAKYRVPQLPGGGIVTGLEVDASQPLAGMHDQGAIAGGAVAGGFRPGGGLGPGGGPGFTGGRQVTHDRAGAIVETGADQQGYPVAFGVLGGAQMDHPATGRRQFAQFLPGQPRVALGMGNLSGVGSQDTVHILADLAVGGAQGRCQGHRRGIAAPSAESGDFLLSADALEPGHHHHGARGQGLANAVAPDLEDAGIGMARVGNDATLAAGETDGGAIHIGQRHGQQAHGNALAHGKEHVQLASGRRGMGLGGQR